MSEEKVTLDKIYASAIADVREFVADSKAAGQDVIEISELEEALDDYDMEMREAAAVDQCLVFVVVTTDGEKRVEANYQFQPASFWSVQAALDKYERLPPTD